MCTSDVCTLSTYIHGPRGAPEAAVLSAMAKHELYVGTCVGMYVCACTYIRTVLVSVVFDVAFEMECDDGI